MQLINSLDTWTLNIIFMMLHFSVTSISILMLFVYDKEYVKPLALGYSVSLLGFVCLAYQGQIHSILSIVLSNTFVLIGNTIIADGLLRIINKKLDNRLCMTMYVMHILGFLYFTYISPSMPARVVFLSVETMIITFNLIYYYVIEALNRPRTLTILMAFSHSLYLPVLTVRIYNVMSADHNTWIMHDQKYAFIQFWTIILIFFRVVLTILLIANDFEIELKKKNNLLYRLSYTDTLTGLHNVRSVLEKLEIEKSRVIRYHNKASIAMLDIDFFKKINDANGHVFGDQVLKTFAEICLRELRSVDVISRYGGEEFLIIMPETDCTSAVEIMQRLQNSMSHNTWMERDLDVTFSAGVLEIDALNAADDIRSLIDQADQALYTAKKLGRNRVELVQPE